MSETEQVASTESTPDGATIAAALPDKVETTEATTTESKPAGYEPIDPKTATPEQTQARIDYIYRQLKPTQRENKEMRQLLADQSRIITELSEGQRVVVNHLTEKSYNDSETQLKQQMQDAWKKSDNVAYIDAQTRLNEIYAQRAVAKIQQPQQPQQQNNSYNPQSATNGAQESVISPEDYRTTESWQNERDDTGNAIRPWAFGTHPNHRAALRETAAVFENPAYENLDYAAKLAEVDKRMGVKKSTNSQQVLGGNLTKPGKKTTIELSPKQREIALRTSYAGKGKSEAEHLAAYRKQVEKIDSQRRPK